MGASNSKETAVLHLKQNTQLNNDSNEASILSSQKTAQHGHTPLVSCSREQEVLEEHGYTVIEKLGKGAPGKAFLVACNEGNSYVAKVIDFSNRNAEIEREVEILKKLNHGYIVTYKDSFEEAGMFFIVMEYCAEGDLYKRMEKQNGCFEEQQILDWLVQICLALKYLHENNVLHRDIKPQNVFLNEGDYICLGDFGFSIKMESLHVSVVGAQLYFSPEVMESGSNSKSDIWSLGWMLHDLCMLDVFFNFKCRYMLHAKSMGGIPPEISKTYSENLRDLIKEMLSCDPKNRPSAEEILAKPFLKDVVIKNKRIPKALLKRIINTIRTFDETCIEHCGDLKTFAIKLKETANSLEEMHRKTTIGSLSGGVIGAAGGVTAVVGAILAPFTFGASLIVTIVGASVATAGGITGAASSITNKVKQKTFREEVQKIEQSYKNTSEPILTSLDEVRKMLIKLTKFQDFESPATLDELQMGFVNNRNGTLVGQVMHLGMLGNVARLAAQTARTAKVVGAAVSGVLSGLFLVLDIAFIVADSREIHEIRQQRSRNDPETIRSEVLKLVAQLNQASTDLDIFTEDIKTTRKELIKIEEQVRENLESTSNI